MTLTGTGINIIKKVMIYLRNLLRQTPILSIMTQKKKLRCMVMRHKMYWNASCYIKVVLTRSLQDR